MADQYKKPYLESSIFIAWIKAEIKGGINCKDVVQHVISLAEQGHYRITTSTWTLAEVHKRKRGPILPTALDDKILQYFENPYIDLVDVTRAIGEEANRLARKHNLKPTDSVHLACALRQRCDVVLSYDPDFTKIPNPPIRIEEPMIIPINPLPLLDGIN